ncbi:hypothetical protein JD844_017854 [Phrynosoma platyrhinos]|uniref:EF-hand domain-containing protein n=1 Tax=Phrynosoma platyrhinos TaxID=52577 RepID=A0ABQ7SMF7_PHRPL|nr:hypothetical protein JD844_017854 [Phrynosoma platyrhinos]
MAGTEKSNASPFSEQTVSSESFNSQRSQNYEEEIFYKNCRAAYLAVFKSSLENIKSKEQLCLVLQQAGRNPSQKTVDKYWTPQTTTLNFDDFCFILNQAEPVKSTELLKAFAKIDANNNGYLLHSELSKILTTSGEKMSPDEFCKLYMTVNEQCLKNALEKLEADCKLKRQQFGNQLESSSEMARSPVSKTLPKTTRETEAGPLFRKGLRRSSSVPSYKICVSSTISMNASYNKNSKLTEANATKGWHCAQSKGCFFLQDNREIISHQYKLFLPQTSTVCITIKPAKLSQMEALYIFKDNETEDNLQLVCFTELRNKEVFGWRGKLDAGVYQLIPFTTGCKFKKVKKEIRGEAKLVYRDGSGKAVLSEIFEMIDLDGNGFLSLEEYNFFEMTTSGEKCDEDTWAICKESFEMKGNELTKQGFMDLILVEASEQGEELSLWKTLLSMGYSRAMDLTEACPFSIHIYADKCKPQIRPVCLETGGEQLKNAICVSVVNKGDAKPMDRNENIIIHTYKSDTQITVVIENKVCQHVMPLNDKEEWIYSCVYSVLS